VQQSGDMHRLIISVDIAPAESVAESPNVPVAPELPVASSSALTAEQLLRVEDRARRATAQTFAPPAKRRGEYAINLESAIQPIDVTDVDAGRFAADLNLYATKIVVADRTWHRLRLGFFASERDAELAMASLKSRYPNAWVVRVSPAEYDVAAASPVVSPAPMALQVAPVAEVAPTIEAAADGGGLNGERLAELAEEGRAAMLAGDNGRAVQIYTRILREPENEYTREAQEYLGLSRERSGQLAHAIAEYRRYLMLYPDGDDAARVRQRLAGLVSVREVPAEPGEVVSTRHEPGRWDVYGGLAQYYRRDAGQFGDRESVTSQSSVLTDFDLVARRRGDRFDLSSRATLGNLYDLLSEGEGPGNSTRIYYLYADLVDSRLDTSLRLGRQALHGSGVLGRFDGAQLSWQWRPNTRFNIVTGFPVDSTADGMDTERSFYGISTDLTSVLELFDVNLFYNIQEVDGLEDRQAIGGEVRYYDDARSLITLLDYDVSFGEVNSFVMLGNWAFANRVTLNARVDTRKTPLLTTRNALIGQPFTTLDELVESLGEEQVRQLARDRTGDMQTYSLGVSSPLFDRFQVNADLTMLNYSGTPASGNVPAIPDVSGDLYYSLTLIGTGLLTAGDTTVFGMGYVDGSSASTMTFSVDARYPVVRGFRVNPRLRVSLREIVRTQSDQWIAAPSLRLLYRFARRYQFDLEFGGEWSSQKTGDASFDYNTYFIYGGYRADF